jgi:BlaI family penicillinase repressor
MATPIEKITDAELEVLKARWDSGAPRSVAALRRRLAETTPWEASTVKTLLYRLCAKGAVTSEKRDVFYYSPAVTEREVASHAARDVIRRLYGGSAKKLVASLLGEGGLADADVAELRALLTKEEPND